MQCKECRKFLSDFLDGQLPAHRQKKMREHLRSCAECSRALESISKMVNLMHSMGEAEPPADFLDKVNARIDADVRQGNLRERLAGLWPQRLPMQVAAVLATLVLAVYVSKQIKPDLFVMEGTSRRLSVTDNYRFSQTRQEEQARKRETAVGKADVQSALVGDLGDDLPFQSDGDDYSHGEFKKKGSGAGGHGVADKETRLQVSGEKIIVCEGPVCKFSEEEIVLREELNNEIYSRTQAPAAPSSKTVVMDMKQGNYIAANRQQKWVLVSSSARKEVLSLLEEMRASDISQETISTEKDAVLVRFTIAFRQVAVLLSRLEKMGTVTLTTPLPVPRPEAYSSARGAGINLKLLEEPIPVELILKKAQ